VNAGAEEEILASGSAVDEAAVFSCDAWGEGEEAMTADTVGVESRGSDRKRSSKDKPTAYACLH
jgi:hypothetical protein